MTKNCKKNLQSTLYNLEHCSALSIAEILKYQCFQISGDFAPNVTIASNRSLITKMKFNTDHSFTKTDTLSDTKPVCFNFVRLQNLWSFDPESSALKQHLIRVSFKLAESSFKWIRFYLSKLYNTKKYDIDKW